MEENDVLGTPVQQASIFERLKDPAMREAFIGHKARKFADDSEELSEITSYVMSDACTEDLQKLADGVFDFPIARQVKLRKSHSDRRRIIYVYPPRQNCLMKYLVWGLHEYDGIFSDSLYSFRRNLNVTKLFKRVIRKNYVRNLWTVKGDVHDYGHSIRPEHLIPMLEKIVKPRDPALFNYFVYMLERNEFLVGNTVVHESMGGLPGVPIGCFFNNVYLMELDAAMERRSELYSRYADDICVFVHTKEQAEAALTEMREIIHGLDIELNEEKTQLIEPGGDVELLGIEIRDGELDVADSTLAKAKTKLEHYANKLIRRERRKGLPRERAAQLMASKIKHYFYSTDENKHKLSWRDYFFFTITRPDSLRELDLFCQELIRRVATGKHTNAKYRFRYKDIRALGYVPLVRDYYDVRAEWVKLAS